MEYHICNIRNCNAEAGKNYFFDSNFWFPYFLRVNNPKANEKPYFDFFEKVLKFPDSPKPKIIVTSALISEVVNRSLRSVAMLKFARSNGDDPKNLPKGYYKTVYRQSKEFCDDYEYYISNFRGFLGNIVFAKDGSDQYKPSEILSTSNLKLDFNDNLFYMVAKTHGYSIVTHDGDFWVRGVEIITSNQRLIDKQNEYVGKLTMQRMNKKL